MSDERPNTDPMHLLGLPIPIERIEFRVQSINRGGYATLLAYKDARVDMDRLDAAVGRGFWQRKHERIANDLHCSVGIYNREIKEWIWVQDVGVPSKESSVKGEASDAFKRACFNIGIGRELYDYPLVSVKLNDKEYYMEGDKAKAGYELKIRDWVWHATHHVDEYGRATIKTLKGVDQHNNIRFSYPTTGQHQPKQGDPYAYTNPEDAQSSAPPAQNQPQQRQDNRGGSRSQQAPNQNNGRQQNHNQRGNDQRGQQRQQNSNQGSSGNSRGNQLEWYNDFEKEKDFMAEEIQNGNATADQIINGLKKNFRLNKTTEAKIRAL